MFWKPEQDHKSLMLVDSQSGFAEQNLVMFNQTLGSGTDCQL
jgi:hypothetical protein